jgi:hypothetical protein
MNMGKRPKGPLSPSEEHRKTEGEMSNSPTWIAMAENERTRRMARRGASGFPAGFDSDKREAESKKADENSTY